MKLIRAVLFCGPPECFSGLAEGAIFAREFDLMLAFESAYIPVVPQLEGVWEMPLDFVLVLLGAAAAMDLVQKAADRWADFGAGMQRRFAAR